MKTCGSKLALPCGLGRCLVALLLSVSLAGCAKNEEIKLGKVSGKVTQGGQPLVAAEVMFIPKGIGAPSGGRTDENGRFELRFSDGRPGAVPGQHGVAITVSGPEVAPPTGNTQAPPPAKEPLEFHTEAEVKLDGENDFSFEVSPQAPGSAAGH